MEIQLFTYENKEIRTINKDGQMWFVALDIAKVTGHDKIRNAIYKILDEDEALSMGLEDASGHIQDMLIVNESGFYKLMFRSRLPQAKAFTKFVTSVILPAIRKTGQYNPNAHMYSEVLQLKGREKELSAKRNEINKELRFIKMQIEQTEARIYEPYKHIVSQKQMQLQFTDSDN